MAAVLVLAVAASLGADEPAGAPPPQGADVEARLRRLEELNQRLLEQNETLQDAQRASDARYGDLERRYDELLRQVRPAAAPLPPGLSPPPPYNGLFLGSDIAEAAAPRTPSRFDAEHIPAGESGRSGESPDHTIGLMRRGASGFDVPLKANLGEGFGISSEDDEYQLRIRLLDQTDAKIFIPNNQSPARSGLYIPRVRVYFEGQLSRAFEYEVSLQRSVEGVWDLLDGNANFVFSEGFQLRFGRMLVPYSYAWYDHLEQYFIAPERALFPLNFGLSRSAGLEAHGSLREGRLEYAVGLFDGHLTGLADDNTIRDGVGYLNARPFLHSERFPALRYLNVGLSGFIGQQVQAQRFLPLRTSLQSSENDEAAQGASTVFFETEDDVFGFGSRSAAAIHLAWYWRGLSVESEIQATRFQVLKAGLPYQPTVPVAGGHVTASYFLTGEHVTGRGPLSPLRPFDPFHGHHGPGAVEFYGRYSQLGLGETVFEQGLANPDDWTRNIYMTDVGLNWYLNKYLKIYVDWQHSNFGSPVLMNPRTGDHSRFADLFWIRCQIYY